MNTVIYTFESTATDYMVHRVSAELNISALIIQAPLTVWDKFKLFWLRLKKHGVLKAFDEFICHIYYNVFLKSSDLRLSNQLFGSNNFKIADNRNIPVYYVDSLNSEKGRDLLKTLSPDIVFMESRELIADKTLDLANIGFIGCHPGILPDYRGAYAPFWAALNLDFKNIGFSIYLADSGIDTGKVIFKRKVDLDVTKGSFRFHSDYIQFESIPHIISTLKQIEKNGISNIGGTDYRGKLYSLVGMSDYIKYIKRVRDFRKLNKTK